MSQSFHKLQYHMERHYCQACLDLEIACGLQVKHVSTLNRLQHFALAR